MRIIRRQKILDVARGTRAFLRFEAGLVRGTRGLEEIDGYAANSVRYHGIDLAKLM
jgi:hypothetical protein